MCQSCQPHFYIRSKRKFERIDLSELIYVESCRGYLKLVMRNKLWMVHASMLTMEKILPAKEFVRIHRSYIVSIQRVHAFDNNEVIIWNGEEKMINFPISKDKYQHALLGKVLTVGEVRKHAILDVSSELV